MGGRGSAGGATVRPAYFNQSEKAVQLKITVEDYDLEQIKSRVVWVPKSQLADDGKPSVWITNQKAQEFYPINRALGSYSATWEDASGSKFKASMTRSETARMQQKAERFNAGVKSYNALIAEAKAMGIKGIRTGMKRKTIEQKIREHKK